MHMTAEVSRALKKLMRLRGLKTKSEAVRVAVLETVAREVKKSRPPDYSSWLGIGCGAVQNSNRRFQTHDDLWRGDHGR
jgi:hypothetical protein